MSDRLSKQYGISKAEKKRLWLIIKRHCDRLLTEAELNNRLLTYRFSHPPHLAKIFYILGLRPPKHLRAMHKFYETFIKKCKCCIDDDQNNIRKFPKQKPKNLSCEINQESMYYNDNYPEPETPTSLILDPYQLDHHQLRKQLSEELPSPKNPHSTFFSCTQQQQQFPNVHTHTNVENVRSKSPSFNIRDNQKVNTSNHMSYSYENSINYNSNNNNSNMNQYPKQSESVFHSCVNNWDQRVFCPHKQQFFFHGNIPRGLPHKTSIQHRHSNPLLPLKHFGSHQQRPFASATIGTNSALAPLPIMQKPIEYDIMSDLQISGTVTPVFLGDSARPSYSSRLSSCFSSCYSPRESDFINIHPKLYIPAIPSSTAVDQPHHFNSLTPDSQYIIQRKSRSLSGYHRVNNSNNYRSPFDCNSLNGHILENSGSFQVPVFGHHSAINSIQLPDIEDDDDVKSLDCNSKPNLHPVQMPKVNNGPIVGFYRTNGEKVIQNIQKYLQKHISNGLTLDLFEVFSRTPSSLKSNFTPTTSTTGSTLTPEAGNVFGTSPKTPHDLLFIAPEVHNELSVLVIIEPCKLFELLIEHTYGVKSKQNDAKLETAAETQLIQYEIALNACYLYLERRIHKCAELSAVFFIGCAVFQTNKINDVCQTWENIFCKRDAFLLNCRYRMSLVCKKKSINFYSFMTSTMASMETMEDSSAIMQEYFYSSYKSVFPFQTHEQISHILKEEISHVKKNN